MDRARGKEEEEEEEEADTVLSLSSTVCLQ
jgi:hypothetical protein